MNLDHMVQKEIERHGDEEEDGFDCFMSLCLAGLIILLIIIIQIWYLGWANLRPLQTAAVMLICLIFLFLVIVLIIWPRLGLWLTIALTILLICIGIGLRGF